MISTGSKPRFVFAASFVSSSQLVDVTVSNPQLQPARSRGPPPESMMRAIAFAVLGMAVSSTAFSSSIARWPRSTRRMASLDGESTAGRSRREITQLLKEAEARKMTAAAALKVRTCRAARSGERNHTH